MNPLPGLPWTRLGPMRPPNPLQKNRTCGAHLSGFARDSAYTGIYPSLHHCLGNELIDSLFVYTILSYVHKGEGEAMYVKLSGYFVYFYNESVQYRGIPFFLAR